MISYGFEFLLFSLSLLVFSGTVFLIIQGAQELMEKPPKLNLCDGCNKQLEEHKQPTLEPPL